MTEPASLLDLQALLESVDGDRELLDELAGTFAHEVPGWIELNPSELTVKVVAVPTQDQIPFDVNPNLIVEFYR